MVQLVHSMSALSWTFRGKLLLEDFMEKRVLAVRDSSQTSLEFLKGYVDSVVRALFVADVAGPSVFVMVVA